MLGSYLISSINELPANEKCPEKYLPFIVNVSNSTLFKIGLQLY